MKDGNNVKKSTSIFSSNSAVPINWQHVSVDSIVGNLTPLSIRETFAEHNLQSTIRSDSGMKFIANEHNPIAVTEYGKELLSPPPPSNLSSYPALGAENFNLHGDFIAANSELLNTSHANIGIIGSQLDRVQTFVGSHTDLIMPERSEALLGHYFSQAVL